MLRLSSVGLLALMSLSLVGCSHVKAFTSPTWVYTNGDDRLELLNSNADNTFCLHRKTESQCGEYQDNPDIFASAMAHFKKPQDYVPTPTQPSKVEFKTGDASWTWNIQPDGSFLDEKGNLWKLAEFQQFGKTYTE